MADHAHDHGPAHDRSGHGHDAGGHAGAHSHDAGDHARDARGHAGARGHAHDDGGHAHDAGGHDHSHRSAPARALAIALALTGGFMIVEAIAGWASGSLALMSDAGHMLSDSGALALALAAQRVADRPRTRTRTFGFRRAETLAALANATALAASAVLIVIEAVRRLAHGAEPIEGRTMLAVAGLGLAINVTSAIVLSRGREKNANVRAALAHVLSDAAGSVAAITAGVLVIWRGWAWADPACSLVIAILIAIAAVRLVQNASGVLMEGAPAGLDVGALEKTIRGTPGVREMHDLHAWRIEEGFDAVTVHVVLAPEAHGVEVAREVARRIHREHGVEHVTVQPEAASESIVPVEALKRPRSSRSPGSER